MEEKTKSGLLFVSQAPIPPEGLKAPEFFSWKVNFGQVLIIIAILILAIAIYLR